MLLVFSLACLWFTDYSRWFLLGVEYSKFRLSCFFLNNNTHKEKALRGRKHMIKDLEKD